MTHPLFFLFALYLTFFYAFPCFAAQDAEHADLEASHPKELHSKASPSSEEEREHIGENPSIKTSPVPEATRLALNSTQAHLPSPTGDLPGTGGSAVSSPSAPPGKSASPLEPEASSTPEGLQPPSVQADSDTPSLRSMVESVAKSPGPKETPLSPKSPSESTPLEDKERRKETKGEDIL